MNEESNTDLHAPRRGRLLGRALVGVVALGLLWLAGSWAKERWVDPHHMLVSVHPATGDHAIAFFRYDGKGEFDFRVGLVQAQGGELVWERTLPHPDIGSRHNGISNLNGVLAVLVDETSDTGTVQGLDPATGDVLWSTELEIDDGNGAELMGNETHIFIDAHRRGIHVLERASGAVVYRNEENRFTLGFNDDWLELGGETYLRLSDAKPIVMDRASRSGCLVGDELYRLSSTGELSAHALRTGEVRAHSAPLDAPVTYAESCGWRLLDADRLQLVFTASGNRRLAFAISLDRDRSLSSAHLDWTLDFGDARPNSDAMSYHVNNIWDLPWLGRTTRFIPLELSSEIESGEYESRLALVDVEKGVVVRQGQQVDDRFWIVRAGEVHVVEVRGRDREDFILTVDGVAGEVLGAVSLEGASVVQGPLLDDGLWVWAENSFSRESNMALSILDRTLQVRHTPDPGRAPADAPSAAARLFGMPP